MPDSSTQTNPLSAAFEAASVPETPVAQSGFIESTLALLDGPIAIPAEPTATPAEPTATPAEPTATPAEPTATPAESTTPLDEFEKAIDETYPELDGKDVTPQAKAKWGELRTELKQERAKIREMRTELETLKQKSLYDPAEVETLKKQIEEASKELAIHRIEATPEYKTAIEEPLQVIGDAAASIARRYEIDKDALFDALATTDEAAQQKMLSGLVDGMGERDRFKIYEMAEDTLMILRRRADMKARSSEAMQELEIRQRQTSEREAAERKRTYTSHVDRVFNALEEKLPFVSLDANESKTAVLEALKRDALAADVAAAPDVQAYSAAAGVILPRLIRQNNALTAKVAALEARLGASVSASPGRTIQTAAPAPARQSGDFLENIFSQLPG